MRTTRGLAAICAALLISAAGPACAEPSPRQATAPAVAAAGAMPSPDRPWTPADLPAAASALRGTTAAQLPRLNGPSRAILERISDPATMAACRDRSTRVETRLPGCLEAFQGVVEITGLYVQALDHDDSFADDTMRAAESMMHGAAALNQLMDEFVPTLDPNDPTYQTRMGGVEQTKRGLTTMISGALTMLHERHIYSASARARFAAVIAEVYPSVRGSLTQASQAEFEESLQGLARSDPSAEVRAALAAFSG